MMWPTVRATPWSPSFAAGFAFAAFLFWLPATQPPASAAQPALAPVLRTDTFARVASIRERSVVFLHTVTGTAPPASRDPLTLIESVVQEGLGSGVVIDATGLILTNAHVVEGADAVHVRTTEGEDIDAQVVGTDPDTDVALLRATDARALQPAPLGDSDTLRVGDLVVAIGNPLGLHHTVTTGVISAKARGLGDSGVEFLQTDAAVNPGSSGGPILNLSGEVVGLTTVILSKHGANVGLNFAIPINAIKAILPQLRTGSVVHGWLGVATRSLNPSGARAIGIAGGGLVVTDLRPEGPAFRAGVHIGDVLVGVGEPPATAPPRDIHRQVRESAPGQTLVLRVWRKGQQLSVPVVIQARPPGV